MLSSSCQASTLLAKVFHMNRFPTLLIGICLSVMSDTASATGPSRDRLQECLHHKNQRSAAMQARDWGNMERFANIYIKRCAGVDEPKHFSTAYWEVAMAEMKLGRLASALKSLDSCIQTSYANASCHVEKVFVLIRMKRVGEARKLYDTASPLVDRQLESAERALEGLVSGVEKEALEIERESLRLSQQSLALYAEDLQ